MNDLDASATRFNIAGGSNGADAVPLGSLLAYHAARGARNRAAVIVGDTTVSFSELDARSNRRARMLGALGVEQGDFVTVALHNSLEMYETSFALWKLGAIPNLVSYRLAAPEIAAILDLVKPSLAIGLAPGSVSGIPLIPTDAPIDETIPSDPLPEIVSPHWKAMTSGGSTGRPKVIVDAMPGRWDPKVTFLGQRPGDTLLNPGPLYHNAPFIGMHQGLFSGCTVVEMVRFDAERALELISTRRVGWVNLVPTMMHRIWRLGPEVRSRYDLSSLHTVFHMAAPCPAWLKEAWIDWLGPDRIFELYGGTERQGATIIRGDEWLKHRGSVGKPQPGGRIIVMNDSGGEAEVGEVGEIYMLPDGGRETTYRYIGSTPKIFGEWESLGDLGWFDADGYLYLSDRRTDMIISGGANIYPAEVEAALDAHLDVLSSIAIGLPDDEWGERVHAIVQIAPDAGLDAETLLAFAGERLARFKLPKTFEFVTEPLRDDAGKARRTALRAERSHTGN